MPSSLPQRLIQHGHVAVKECRHGTMIFNVHDRFIGRSLDLYGEWCEAELTALAPILTPGCVVVDVGANIGTHTVSFAKTVGHEGRVFAFEPQRLVHQTLCGNIALNGLTNVVALHAAASDRLGHVRIPAVDPEKEYNFGAVAVCGDDDRGELVESIPIDALDLPGCRLIKVDVEGMEATVLRGAKETIERCQPALFVENNTVEGSAELLMTIKELGYEAYWHIAPYFSRRNFFGCANDVFAQFRPEANLLCVPSRVQIEGLEPAKGSRDDWQQALARIVARTIS
jgi:FkbM family methyltransferase